MTKLSILCTCVSPALEGFLKNAIPLNRCYPEASCEAGGHPVVTPWRQPISLHRTLLRPDIRGQKQPGLKQPSVAAGHWGAGGGWWCEQREAQDPVGCATALPAPFSHPVSPPFLPPFRAHAGAGAPAWSAEAQAALLLRLQQPSQPGARWRRRLAGGRAPRSGGELRGTLQNSADGGAAAKAATRTSAHGRPHPHPPGQPAAVAAPAAGPAGQAPCKLVQLGRSGLSARLLQPWHWDEPPAWETLPAGFRASRQGKFVCSGDASDEWRVKDASRGRFDRGHYFSVLGLGSNLGRDAFFFQAEALEKGNQCPSGMSLEQTIWPMKVGGKS